MATTELQVKLTKFTSPTVWGRQLLEHEFLEMMKKYRQKWVTLRTRIPRGPESIDRAWIWQLRIRRPVEFRRGESFLLAELLHWADTWHTEGTRSEAWVVRLMRVVREENRKGRSVKVDDFVLWKRRIDLHRARSYAAKDKMTQWVIDLAGLVLARRQCLA